VQVFGTPVGLTLWISAFFPYTAVAGKLCIFIYCLFISLYCKWSFDMGTAEMGEAGTGYVDAQGREGVHGFTLAMCS